MPNSTSKAATIRLITATSRPSLCPSRLGCAGEEFFLDERDCTRGLLSSQLSALSHNPLASRSLVRSLRCSLFSLLVSTVGLDLAGAMRSAGRSEERRVGKE